MQSAASQIRSFLVEDALPFWSSTGAYANGCFVEHLDLAARPVDPGFTRVRVQARQLYVYSHAEATGLFTVPGLTDRATDFFVRSSWLGAQLGWAKLIDASGNLVDSSTDLYDVAFSLFALAWRYRVVPDPQYLRIARQTLDFLDREFLHPSGGYENDAARSLPRQQNPHMHLTEALIAWAEASGDQMFLDRASSLIDLYATRFTDAETGALGELFTESWAPAPGDAGMVVEPGHQFEWTWIIGQHGRLSGSMKTDLMRRVMTFGLRHGFDPATGLTVDQIDRSGRIMRASHRLWPQTEAIKASIASAEHLGEADFGRLSAIVDALFKYYLDVAPVRGTWIDQYDAEMRPIADKIPSTSLYHIALAFFEILRFRETQSEL